MKTVARSLEFGLKWRENGRWVRSGSTFLCPKDAEEHAVMMGRRNFRVVESRSTRHLKLSQKERMTVSQAGRILRVARRSEALPALPPAGSIRKADRPFTTTSHTKHYYAGARARRHGRTLESCRVKRSDDRIQWQRGWYSVKSQLSR